MASNVVVTVLAESEVQGEERLVLLVLAELAGVLGDVDAGLPGLARLCRMEVGKVKEVLSRLQAIGALRDAGAGRWKLEPGMGRRGAAEVARACNEGRRGREPFVVPSVEEVSEYARKKGWALDSEEFWLHHEKFGWNMGGKRIRSWKAAVALWAKREERGDFRK